MYARKRIELYGTLVHFVTTEFEWQKLAMRYHLEPLDLAEGRGPSGLTTSAIGWPDSQQHVVIFVDTGYAEKNIVNTIAHEAVHAAGFIFRRIEQKHDGLNEPYAYLVGFLAEWMWGEWKKSLVKLEAA